MTIRMIKNNIYNCNIDNEKNDNTTSKHHYPNIYNKR